MSCNHSVVSDISVVNEIITDNLSLIFLDAASPLAKVYISKYN